MKLKLSEDARRPFYKVATHASWWGALGLLSLHITLGGSRPAGDSPAWLGMLIIALIGTGIAFGTHLSRYRLADTITGVFEAGWRAATSLQCNATSPTCVIEADFDGIIEQVDHAEVIGWRRSDLIGQPLEVVIPDRYLRDHRKNFEVFRKAAELGNPDDLGAASGTLSVPIRRQDGTEKHFRLNVARLGAVLVGTLTPTIEKGDTNWVD